MDQNPWSWGSVFGSSYLNKTNLARVPVENSGDGGTGRGGEGGEDPRRWRWRQAATLGPRSWVQENDERPNPSKRPCLGIVGAGSTGGGSEVAVRVRGEGVGEGDEGGVGGGGLGNGSEGGEGFNNEVWQDVETEGEGVGEVHFLENEQRRKVTFQSTETLDQRLSREFGFFPDAPLIRSEVPSSNLFGSGRWPLARQLTAKPGNLLSNYGQDCL